MVRRKRELLPPRSWRQRLRRELAIVSRGLVGGRMPGVVTLSTLRKTARLPARVPEKFLKASMRHFVVMDGCRRPRTQWVLADFDPATVNRLVAAWDQLTEQELHHDPNVTNPQG
jgi:hypothetical protein